ncbi:hypothetical protein CBE37_02270 [bacterium TMED277]|nr:MAG: hypothetical protein CBE37_02270 [bacterium TMED277]|tara:strand:+ start:394 stop:585 length:192 start_codon:yes stop_codon:yes gene_type:complete
MFELIKIIWGLIQVLPILITICSAVVMMTDTPVDDKLWAKAYKWIDRFALNIGKAKDRNPLLD